ncbi:MAG: hypothetical protein L0215_06530 [Gemmataceae bacterium]|nr:hypothetical protein [Gemmataceae bacterium]
MSFQLLEILYEDNRCIAAPKLSGDWRRRRIVALLENRVDDTMREGDSHD